jgi:hypothetical protein
MLGRVSSCSACSTSIWNGRRDLVVYIRRLAPKALAEVTAAREHYRLQPQRIRIVAFVSLCAGEIGGSSLNRTKELPTL